MKLTNWSVRAAIIASAVASGLNGLYAEDCATPRWRLFGHRTTKAPNPSCDAPSCNAPGCVGSAGGPPVGSAGGPAQEEPKPQVVGAAAAAVPPTMFAAPPPGGEITGEQKSVGIRGFAITMPELRLELPTLHLPSVVQSRRNPEMRMDSARAPMVSGTPAAFGQIANAGVPTFQQQPITTPASAPQTKPPTDSAGGPPPTKPAGVPGCVQSQAALFDPSAGHAQSDEIIEMRRAMIAYRQELDRLKRALDTVPHDATAEGDVPPPPAAPLRRISYPDQRSGSVPVRRRAAEQVVGANYQQAESIEDNEELDGQSRRAAVPRPSAPAKRPADSPRSAPPNVGFSYLPEDAQAVDDGLGIWKGERQQNPVRRSDGSGKKPNR